MFGQAAIGMMALLAAEGPAPADPRALVRFRAEAQILIIAADGADVFENAASERAPRVRHKASGLICTFSSGDPLNRLVILASPVRGDDVVCTTGMASVTSTFHATRSPPISLDEAYAAHVAVIQGDYPAIQPHQGRFRDLGVSPEPGAAMLPARRSGRFSVQSGGADHFARLSVAVVGPWVVEHRLSSPPGAAQQTDMMGEILMAGAVLGVSSSALGTPPEAAP